MFKEIRAEVGMDCGTPALFINGKPREFVTYKIAESAITERVLEIIPDEVPPLLKNGIRLCWIPIFVDWNGPDDYDFSDMDLRINSFVKTVEGTIPDDLDNFAFAIRIQAATFSPEWYIESSSKDGKYVNLIEYRNVWGDAEPIPNEPSMRYSTSNTSGFASTYGISPGDSFWDTHAVDCLQAIIDHVKRQSYHRYVFGYLPCALNSNEWFLHTKSPEACCDFSEPMQKAFHNYLRNKGLDAPENPVPTPEDCHPRPGVSLVGTYGKPRPIKDQNILDVSIPAQQRIEEFSLFLNSRIAEIICNFAAVIKRNYVKYPKLAGFFYGYNIQFSGMNHLSQSGHLGLRRVLSCPDIDFLCSPCLYSYRNDAGPCMFSVMHGAYSESARLYGKMVYAEDDHHPSEFNLSGECRDEWHDEMAFRRNFAMTASHGIDMWHYSLGCGWLAPEHRSKSIGKLLYIANELKKQSRTSNAEVAVVVDERSVSALPPNPVILGSLILRTVATAAQSGAAFDLYELESFFQADVSQYKFVIFCNIIHTDENIRKQINRLRPGRILYFQYAAGYRHDDGASISLSAENASSLTGIRLKQTEPQPLISWYNPDLKQLDTVESDIRYGLGDSRRCNPVLAIDDPEAETFGILANGSPGLAVKSVGGGTVVYSSAPALNPQLQNAFYRQAGVFCRTEAGPIIYENEGMLAISAATRGTVVLKLRQGEILTDAYTGEIFDSTFGAFVELQMKRHETRIYLRATGK
ncbi:MAG: hypothetical protein JXR78_17695 [Victivallales bacterium]|nr:hypothetical protein [Victivallales bacterium]